MRFVVRLLLLVLLLGACGSPPPADKPTPLPIAQPIGSGMPLATAPPEETGNSYDDDAKIPVAKDDPVRGPSNALVTLVLFSDFQCPFCGRFTPTLERAREEFGDDLRIVFKNQPLPFHQHARLAAEVGAAVMATRGNEAFWRYHDMAFRGQQAIGPDAIRQWAIAAGAEPDALESAIVRHTYAGKIDRDQDLAKKVGALGTPASYINGRELSGAQPFEKLSEIIHEERVKAKQLADNGVPRRMIYFRSVANNFTEKKPVADEEPDPDANVVYKVPVGSSPVRGKSTALVTIIEFSDYQCPYCKRVEPTLKKIQSEYGEGTVRIVFKDEPLPFHPRALPAANLARFVRQQKGDAAFWDVHDRLFDSQPKLEDSDLESIARAMGVDATRAMAAVKAKSFDKAIGLDEDLGDDVQATGTPHFFINGKRLVGAQPFEKFKEVIDAELAKAQAMVKSGTPAASVYDTIIRDGKGAPEPERKTIPASATAAFQGPANAPVVIQEFSDFQCPFCQRVEATLDDLMKAYPGKIKLVWRDKPLPMHPDAPLAAEAAREALAQKGNDGFRKMREQLFTHQRDADGLKRPALEGYARTIGLDVTKFNKALDNRIHQAAVDADAKVADDAGISGTPAFVIGPYFLSGAQPLQKFKKLVDRTLNPPPAPKVAPTTTTATGLGIQDIVVGTGKTAKAGDKLTVHYTGTLTNGSVFDSSRTHGKPFDFTLGGGQVIKGWDQGLVGMKVGGRRKLTIPPDLAYGDRGVGTTIPPKSTLVFDVELLSIP